MKAATNDLNTHIQQEVTTLATCWRIRRTDGEEFYYTDSDLDIVANIGDGSGDKTYKASTGYTRTAVKSDATLTVDNVDVQGLFGLGEIDENDLRRGLYNYARVDIFMVNWADPSMGIIKLRRGWFGEVTLASSGFFQTELRGLAQAFTKRDGELYSADCRADLGDTRCRIPIWPELVSRLTAYAVNDVVRISMDDQILEVVNGSFETDLTGWTMISGTAAAVLEDNLINGPIDGTTFLTGTGTADFEISQTIALTNLDDTVIDAGGYAFDFSADQSCGDTVSGGRLIVEYLDAADAVISTPLDTGMLYLELIDDWVNQAIAEDVLPNLCRKVRVRFLGDYVSGTHCAAALDRVRGHFRRIDDTTAERYGNINFRCTVAGTTAAYLAEAYDFTLGEPTTDGTATFVAEESWSRWAEVVEVDSTSPRKKFKVTELTPNTGGAHGGFPTGWFNGGAVTWESGDNIGRAMEVRTHTADDGVIIEQELELYLAMPFDISVGDRLRVFPGCDKRLETCASKFDNVLNRRAEDFVPGPDVINNYPNAKA